MADTLGAHTVSASQIRRFANILEWTVGIALFTTVLYSLVAFFTAISSLWLIVAACVLSGIGVGTARWLLGRGRLDLAILFFMGTVMVASLVVVLAIPIFYASAMLVAVVCFMVLLPLVERRRLGQLLVLVILVSGAVGVMGEFVHLFAPIPAPLDSWLRLAGLTSVLTLLMFTTWQHHSQMEMLVLQLQGTNNALTEAKLGLESQVAERTTALQQALTDVQGRVAEEARLRYEVEQQRDAIRELSVPVLPVLNDTLVMPLIGALDTSRLAQLQEQALAAIERSGARRLVLDVTGVPVVDTQVAQGLVQVVQAARLLGTTATLVGIRPEVAQTLVGLGLDLSQVHTLSDLQAALGERERRRAA